MLTQYLEAFNERNRILVDLLHPKAMSGEFFDIGPFLTNVNVDIITGE